MRCHQLGFSSSWKMLTRDKGWLKPLLVLTIVSWIPILGQIALLGYALEWARLTAWGIDSAPKQSKVVIGKVLRTGGIAFLVALSMALVLSIIETLVFGVSSATTAFPATAGSSVSILETGFDILDILSNLAMLALNLFAGTFISIAMLRSTIYDGFKAGWRLDRIVQMIACDAKGFFKVYLASLIAGFVQWIYSFVLSVLMGLFFVWGIVATLSTPLALTDVDGIIDAGIQYLLQVGPTLLLVFFLVSLALAFVGSVIGVAMELVSINVIGQWFCRFDVARWGVSDDPLPEGVPIEFHDEEPADDMSAALPPAQDDSEYKDN